MEKTETEKIVDVDINIGEVVENKNYDGSDEWRKWENREEVEVDTKTRKKREDVEDVYTIWMRRQKDKRMRLVTETNGNWCRIH